MGTKTEKVLYPLTSIVGAVSFSFSALTFAYAEDVTPTPTPSPSPTDTIVPVSPYTILDGEQYTFIVLPLFVIMALSIATFVITASAPYRLRRKDV